MDEEELILHTAQDLPDHDARGMKRIGTISKAGRIHKGRSTKIHSTCRQRRKENAENNL